MLKAVPSRVLAITLLAIGAAYGQGTVDQQTIGGLTAAGFAIQSYASVGQSFTPTDNSIGYVALALANPNTSGSGQATIYVNLFSGSVNGTLLGSTTPVAVPTNPGYSISDFYFPTAVSLTPGTPYYFDVNVQSGTQWLINQYDYIYSGGSLILNGTAQPGFDLWFQEGIVATPEPSVGWLALLGGGIFLCVRRLKFTTGSHAKRGS